MILNEPSPENSSSVFDAQFPKLPSAAQQSWGALISIIIIVLMIVIGAFYSWNNRTAQINTNAGATADQTIN